MSGVFIEPAADRRLDEIYEYTADQWGEDQADAYIRTLFERLRPNGFHGARYRQNSAFRYISRERSTTSSIGASARTA